MQVQHEVLQKRRLEKKTAMEAVKKFKKGKGERPSFLGGAGEEDSFPVTTESLKKSAQQSGGKKGVIDISKKKSIKVVCFISAKLGVRCPQMLWWQSQ